MRYRDLSDRCHCPFAPHYDAGKVPSRAVEELVGQCAGQAQDSFCWQCLGLLD